MALAAGKPAPSLWSSCWGALPVPEAAWRTCCASRQVGKEHKDCSGGSFSMLGRVGTQCAHLPHQLGDREDLFALFSWYRKMLPLDKLMQFNAKNTCSCWCFGKSLRMAWKHDALSLPLPFPLGKVFWVNKWREFISVLWLNNCLENTQGLFSLEQPKEPNI